MNEAQLHRMAEGSGFIAALDQSGGSTPKALAAYGVTEDRWSSEAEMFDAVHEMRTRIMTSTAFDGSRVLGAILFEDTMNRTVDGAPTAEYLWNKQVVPFVKVDVGLAERASGVQLMKPNPGLDDLLARAVDKGIFGTKMRSVVHDADADGIRSLVAQQFEVGARILGAGLVPIIEPEVSIESPTKADAEQLTLEAIGRELESFDAGPIMLKLTLPDVPNHYTSLLSHPTVLRVVALSGGYDLEESCQRLAENDGMIASFSRVLTNGLSADQPQPSFDSTLDTTIQKIFEASTR